MTAKLGHVLLCYQCAARVGLRETFMLLHGPRECEGCGAALGYEVTRVPREVEMDGEVRTMQWPVFGPMIAPYMEMWRNKMWPVAFGIAVQDFGGAHVHEWDANMSDFRTGERRESCRCGERRTRWVEPTAAPTTKEPR